MQNKVKKLLAEGRLVFGAGTQIAAPALVEITGLAGFDFTMIDTEHGAFDLETAGDLIRAAKAVGTTPLVRVLHNDRGLITKALDLGAQGVIVPHISTRDDAARAVAACKYGTPQGRGACPLVRANDFGLGDWQAFQERSNRETMAIMLVEDLEGVQNIDEILSVDGIDAVFLGPFDMAVGAGYGGNVNHPEIQAAVDRILSACKARNMPVMAPLTSGANVQAWVDRGVRLIMQSSDSVVFARACRSFLDSVAVLRDGWVATK